MTVLRQMRHSALSVSVAATATVALAVLTGCGSDDDPRMTPRSRWVLALLVAAVLALTGCSTTIAGNGTRVGAAPATDFPSNGTNTPAPATSASASASGSSGSSSPSGGDAADLVAATADAMREVDPGFTVSGDFDESGVTSSIDLQLQGTSGQGTVTIGGSTCQVRAVDGIGWANAPADFWTDFIETSDDVAAQIAGQWVELSGDIEYLLVFADQEAFVETVVSTDEDYTLGDTTTVDGVAAQEVEGDAETLVIATDSPHLLLSVEDDSGTSEFTFPDTMPAVEKPTPTIPFPG